MIYIEFDEERLTKDFSVSGDCKMNARQFASLMAENEGLAKVVAMALPYYVHLTEETSMEYAVKMMELAEDDYHNPLVRAGEIE